MKICYSFLCILLITFIIINCKSRLFELGIQTNSEKVIAEKMVKNIIESLENKDADSLRKLFSINASKKTKKLDEGILYLNKFYKGKLISFEDKLGSSSEQNEYGKKNIRINRSYLVKTDLNSYKIDMSIIHNDNDENDNGLFQLEVVKDDNKRGVLWILHSDTPGILWEEQLVTADYIAGATRALSNGFEDLLFAIFSKEAQNEVKNLNMQITNVTKMFRGYADYDNFPIVDVISTQNKGNRTIVKATCELPTKTFDKTKDISYLIYFVYIKNAEQSDDGGFYTIKIVEKTDTNNQFKIDNKPGIYYKGHDCYFE